MAWFRRNNSKNRKKKTPETNLKVVQRENIEWLRWKYRNLSLQENTTHYCFLIVETIVDKNDSVEKAKGAWNDFRDDIKRKPETDRKYEDPERGIYVMWKDSKLLRCKNDKLNLSSLKKAASCIPMNRKGQQYKNYWAYIYRLVFDGILCNDKKGISVDNFMTMMSGIEIFNAARNTIYDYKPRGNYPDYLPATKESKSYSKKKDEIRRFVIQFADTYKLINSEEISPDNYNPYDKI